MSEEGQIVKQEPLGIDKGILKNFETYEDYLDYYIRLEEASVAVSWIKADLLLDMSTKLSLTGTYKLSEDIGQPRGTIVNYIRTARAFPPEKRNPVASFTHHFQASFADEYNEEEGKFLTNNRFDWINKSVDDHLSVRRLKQQIDDEKIKNGTTVVKPCSRCGKTDENTLKYILYSPGEKAEKFYFDPKCWQEVVEFANFYEKSTIKDN